jgi:hypothetical protein
LMPFWPVLLSVPAAWAWTFIDLYPSIEYGPGADGDATLSATILISLIFGTGNALPFFLGILFLIWLVRLSQKRGHNQPLQSTSSARGS